MTKDFEEFWHIYPRKKGKGAAMQSFEKARKIASLDAIIQGVELLVREIKYLGTELQFVPHASTWLNQRRWEDDYEVAPTREESEARRESNLALLEEARKRWGMG